MRNKTLEIITMPLHKQRRIRFIIGLMTGLAGLLNMLTFLLPRPSWDVLLGAWPVDIYHGAHKLIVVIGFFLIMISYAMIRGKRQAWLASTLLLLLSALLYALSGGPVFALALIVTLVGLLMALARHFQARSDPPRLRRGYAALLAGLGIVTLYSIGAQLFLYNEFEALIDRFGPVEVLIRLLTNSHLPPLARGTQAFFLGHAMPLLCLSAVLYGIIMILRPVAAAFLPNEREQEAASALTHTYGTNSIAYFALEAGKSLFFSTSGKSFISYVLEGDVAVVAGDPVGPAEELLPTVLEFLSYCHTQDWTTVFWQTRDSYIDLYRQANLHTLKIGEDAIIDTGTFRLEGKAMANARTSARHAEKAGLHIVFYQGHVEDAGQLVQMEQISREWLAAKGGTEMGFSMGRFDVHGDEEQVYAVAVDAYNRVYGFVSFIPIYGRSGWGIDLMRRAASVPSGMMELLIVRSVEYLKARGAKMVSLGLAPMSNINQDEENFIEYSIDRLSSFVGDLSKKSSLCNFKKKFQPTWESRYLVYSRSMELPKVGWALYRAHQRDVSLYHMIFRALRRSHDRHGHEAVKLAGARNAPSTGNLMV